MGDLPAVAALRYDHASERSSAWHSRPQIVTFSGIDGAGKTTQINSLSAYLSQRGFRVAHVVFWDDVACPFEVEGGCKPGRISEIVQRQRTPSPFAMTRTSEPGT